MNAKHAAADSALFSAARAAEKSSNFFLAFLVLPAAKRRALTAVYAYCRLIDDIVDSGTLAPEEAGRMLAFWRAEIDRLFSGHPTHSVSAALAAHVKAFKLPREPFLEIIRGCEMDLTVSRYETFEALEPYLQGVAAAVGELSAGIFGHRWTPADRIKEFAKCFGYAFQLTNIIRDVGSDLELGRVYLPLSDMKEAGYTMEALIHRDHNAAFTRLMNLEYARAKIYYQRARSALDFRDRPAMLPAEIMAHIYEGLLDEIKAAGFRVLFSRTSLSGWAKLRRALAAGLYSYGL